MIPQELRLCPDCEAKAVSYTHLKDVDRIVKGDLNVCDHLMKWYGDKYDFAEAEVKYNTFNGRFYIYGRMRLRKGTAHDKGKK